MKSQCIHTALLPSSRLLCIERPHENPYPFNANTNGRTATEVKLLNDDGEWAPSWTVKPLRTNAFCAGHVQLGDGSILVAGGDMREVPDEVGVLKYLTDGRRGVRKYVPCTTSDCDTGEWTDFPDMLVERWYPTAATLADGSAIIISGTKDSLTLDGTSTDAIKNPTYEYFPPKEGEWPRNLEILNWAHPFVLYPQVFQLPSGGVFLFVSNKSVIIDPETDIVTDDFRDLTSPTHLPWIYPWSPNMVMLPMLAKNKYRCELLMCGGSYSGPAGETLSSNECFRLNTTAKGSGWVKETQGMPYGQVMLDSAILPGMKDFEDFQNTIY